MAFRSTTGPSSRYMSSGFRSQYFARRTKHSDDRYDDRLHEPSVARLRYHGHFIVLRLVDGDAVQVEIGTVIGRCSKRIRAGGCDAPRSSHDAENRIRWRELSGRSTVESLHRPTLLKCLREV